VAADKQTPEQGRDSSNRGASEARTSSGLFPTTVWRLLEDIRGCAVGSRNVLLNRLIRMYWKPLYTYARLKGHKEEDAKDLVQAFLLACIAKNFFAKADRSKARFRTFLRTSFDNFAKNERRGETAQRRKPPRGIISLDDLMAGTDEGLGFEPRDEETPEDVYSRVWARELLLRAVRALREECRATGKETHWAIFELRIVKPILEDAALPSLEDLAKQFHVTIKQAGNYLLSARRICLRLLRDEIRTYAFSEEDAAAEMNDLRFAFD
jgi:RNA polymerase sigma factor (sigma-70 family)